MVCLGFPRLDGYISNSKEAFSKVDKVNIGHGLVWVLWFEWLFQTFQVNFAHDPKHLSLGKIGLWHFLTHGNDKKFLPLNRKLACHLLYSMTVDLVSAQPLSGPRRLFRGPLSAILDLAGSTVLQAVSECPRRR